MNKGCSGGRPTCPYPHAYRFLSLAATQSNIRPNAMSVADNGHCCRAFMSAGYAATVSPRDPGPRSIMVKSG